MYIVAGLGNPGKKYQFTRHNIGYQAIDLLSSHFNIRVDELKCMSLIGRGSIDDSTEVVLARPLTYMNRSGQAIKCLKEFFKVSISEIIVIYDDMDIPPGFVRIKPSGGAGGHRGIESIINHLGSNQFGRIRIGIGRPEGGQSEVDYVLSPFDEIQKKLVDEKLKLLPEIITSIINRGYNYAMSTYNRRIRFSEQK